MARGLGELRRGVVVRGRGPRRGASGVSCGVLHFAVVA